jgi:hypothetical protein
MKLPTEQTVHDQFIGGPMKMWDAVAALKHLGHSHTEAKRIVLEWAESAQAERDSDRK